MRKQDRESKIAVFFEKYCDAHNLNWQLMTEIKRVITPILEMIFYEDQSKITELYLITFSLSDTLVIIYSTIVV